MHGSFVFNSHVINVTLKTEKIKSISIPIFFIDRQVIIYTIDRYQISEILRFPYSFNVENEKGKKPTSCILIKYINCIRVRIAFNLLLESYRVFTNLN